MNAFLVKQTGPYLHCWYRTRAIWIRLVHKMYNTNWYTNKEMAKQAAEWEIDIVSWTAIRSGRNSTLTQILYYISLAQRKFSQHVLSAVSKCTFPLLSVDQLRFMSFCPPSKPSRGSVCSVYCKNVFYFWLMSDKLVWNAGALLLPLSTFNSHSCRTQEHSYPSVPLYAEKSRNAKVFRCSRTATLWLSSKTMEAPSMAHRAVTNALIVSSRLTTTIRTEWGKASENFAAVL